VRNTRPRRSLRRVLLLALAACLLALGIAELIQWWLLPAPHPLRRRPGPAVFTFHTDGKLLPGISGETHFTTESHGLRYPREIAVPKPAGTYRIFCVGGSTTECTYLDDEDAWPRRVEDLLREKLGRSNIEVINAGFSGMTSADHVQQIEEQLLPLMPDGIVLMTGMNDHIRRQSLGAAPRRSWGRAVMDYSMTARRAIFAWRAISGSTGADGTYAMDPKGEIYARLRAVCAAVPVTADAAVFAALPDPLPHFRDSITRTADACAARGVRLVLATHPSIYTADLPREVEALLWMRATLSVDARQPSLSWHAAELERLNAWMRAFARERGLPLIDAAAALPKTTACFYDDCHLNVAGAARLAEIAGPVLLAEIGKPDASRGNRD